MATERERERFSFSGAWLAIPIGVVLAPAFVGAPTASGADGIAIATMAIASSITLAVALGANRRSSAAALGALTIGPSVATVLAARVAAEQPLAAELAGSDGSLPLMTTLGAVVLAAVGARAAQLEGAQRAPRMAAAALAATAFLAATALASAALIGRPAPSAAERLDALAPDSGLEVMVDDGGQTVAVAPGVELRRLCEGNFCEIVASVDRGHGDQIGARQPLPDDIDRAPLAIVSLHRVIAVVPRDRSGRLDWSRAMAFDTVTAQAAPIHVRDLTVSVAPPPSWRAASWVGIGIALLALALAVAARRARRRIDAGTDATVEPDGTLRLASTEIVRGPRGLDPGPVVVLDRAPGRATYREDGLATVARAVPGTQASWRARLADRTLGLELAALGTLLLTHAPLLAAWLAGYAVLGH